MADSDALLCGICQEYLVKNVRCTSCDHRFCGSCLGQWYRRGTTCPFCRRDQSFDTYVHDADIESQVKNETTMCTLCNHVMAVGHREDHVAHHCPQALVKCPYVGCGQAPMKRVEMDNHVFACRYRVQYEQAQEPTVVEAEEGKPTYGIHEIKDHDTLPGLAIRYRTTVAEIKTLNKLTSDNIFMRRTLKVPYNEENKYGLKVEEPSSEVVEALRKRKLIKQLMREAQCDLNEAISYLSMYDYDYMKALKRQKADTYWETHHPPTQEPFSVFVARTKEKEKAPAHTHADPDLSGQQGSSGALIPTNCHHCLVRDLNGDRDRKHCTSCGKVFCGTCAPGQCSKKVPKGALGATSPEAHHTHVDVCNACVA
eukprot:Colp12_sorted_trinity150504_noHs@32395